MTTYRVLTITVGLLAAAVPLGAQQPAAAPAPQSLKTSKLIGHETVAACTKAAPLLATPEQIVMCGYRTGPGEAEVHLKETDVFYVLDGAATFVTGGKVQGLTSTDPLQPRAKSLEGGVAHTLVKGDVIVVPAGEPHWFKEVPKSVSYFVVKVLKP
jgi:mannose-6-phosphate isomerase-like protein (cupin superfamily)